MAIKLKLELKWTKIKRVITVPPRMTLTDLNDVIQAMFGFEHDHLWNFQSKDGREWNTGRDPMGGRLNMDMRGMLDPDRFFIEDVLTAAKAQILFSYDYGDGWKVDVTRMADSNDDEIACIETAGTNAMEDIGGVGGLEEFTELLKNCTIKSEDEITDDTDWRIAEWGVLGVARTCEGPESHFCLKPRIGGGCKAVIRVDAFVPNASGKDGLFRCDAIGTIASTAFCGHHEDRPGSGDDVRRRVAISRHRISLVLRKQVLFLKISRNFAVHFSEKW